MRAIPLDASLLVAVAQVKSVQMGKATLYGCSTHLIWVRSFQGGSAVAGSRAGGGSLANCAAGLQLGSRLGIPISNN